MGPEGVGRREGGAKGKSEPQGLASLRSGWGREGVPTPSGTHLWLRVLQRRGETLGETVGEGNEGTKGNRTSAFPVHLGTGEPVGLPGLILCPWSLPPAMQNPSPAPTPPPRALPLHLETPSKKLGLNPTHTSSLRALPPNSRTPHPRGPPFDMLPLPFCAGPKQKPHPTLEHRPT